MKFRHGIPFRFDPYLRYQCATPEDRILMEDGTPLPIEWGSSFGVIGKGAPRNLRGRLVLVEDACVYLGPKPRRT